MKIKQAIKYGALAGASFTIGYTVAQVHAMNDTPDTNRSMSYSVDRAYDILDRTDEQIEVLEELGLYGEAQHIESASRKIWHGIVEARANDEDHVDVEITADEFAAWVISILGKESDLDGTGRQG